MESQVSNLGGGGRLNPQASQACNQEVCPSHPNQALEPSLSFIDFPYVRFGLVARLVALTFARLLRVARLKLGLVARWPG